MATNTLLHAGHVGVFFPRRRSGNNTTADALRLAVYVSLAQAQGLPHDMAAGWASPEPFPSWDHTRSEIVQRQAEPAVLTGLGRRLLRLEIGRDRAQFIHEDGAGTCSDRQL